VWWINQCQLPISKCVEKQASGRQPRRAAFVESTTGAVA